MGPGDTQKISHRLTLSPRRHSANSGVLPLLIKFLSSLMCVYGPDSDYPCWFTFLFFWQNLDRPKERAASNKETFDMTSLWLVQLFPVPRHRTIGRLFWGGNLGERGVGERGRGGAKADSERKSRKRKGVQMLAHQSEL